MKHVKVHMDGLKEADTETPTIEIDAVGGKVVAYVGSDIDCYSEVFVDFIADDGRVMQLACVGQDHAVEGMKPEMHGYVWDGIHEDCKHTHTIEVGDDSYWYDFG